MRSAAWQTVGSWAGIFALLPFVVMAILGFDLDYALVVSGALGLFGALVGSLAALHHVARGSRDE
ncbi:hypothetical protein [Microbacterium sp. 16-032]|uniref:hypothetical protein n=1 Tax=Microbacterium sp. 16-032 TaxID=3239808 RepID=UPI0034E2E99D